MRCTIPEALAEIRQLESIRSGNLVGVAVAARYRTSPPLRLDGLPAAQAAALRATLEACAAGVIDADTPAYLVYSNDLLVAWCTVRARGRHTGSRAQRCAGPPPASGGAGVVRPQPPGADQARGRPPGHRSRRHRRGDAARNGGSGGVGGRPDHHRRHGPRRRPRRGGGHYQAVSVPAAHRRARCPGHHRFRRVRKVRAPACPAGAVRDTPHRRRHRLAPAVVGDWITANGGTNTDLPVDDLPGIFAAHCVGVYPTRSAYAEQHMTDSGWTEAIARLGIPARYLNINALQRDLFDHTVQAVDTTSTSGAYAVAVFRRISPAAGRV